MESDTWLFDSDIRPEQTDMGEIRALTGVLLIWSKISRQSNVWEVIFDVRCMPDSMRTVLGGQICTREHGTHHISKLAQF